MSRIAFRGLTANEWNDRNVQKVLQFYLFESPVPGTSRAGKCFSELGWKGSYFSTLKAQLLHLADDSFAYIPCIKDELPEALAARPPAKAQQEYTVFLKHDERRVIESLFRAIRNSIAHGSFSRYTRNKCVYYYFENEDGYVKARINVKEKTLLEWAKAVNEDPETVRLRLNNRKPKTRHRK